MPLETNADKAYMHDLPKVSFKVVTDDKASAPAGVQSEQIRFYGYNNSADFEFERPDYYIRYIEPIESELAVQVEYDMDEQDQEWLDMLNAERKKDQSGVISYELFEIIMDKLEKEWFALSKKIPQPTQHQTAEDSKCVICDDGEGENSNAIVFCDGCNLAVHQDCYGVPYIPEGQWLCRKCTVSPENPVSCIFCPNEGGAFKQTTTGHWAHLLCSIWIPETGLGNAIYMEPVEGVENIPKSRWKLVCSLCRDKSGACIQCDNRNCFTAFHVTCARQVGLLQSMKSLSTDGLLKAYCTKHLPAESREDDSDTASNFSSYEESTSAPVPARTKSKSKAIPTSGPIIIPVTKKSAQAHSKSFKPGPPIVPKIIVNKLLDYVAKISFRKKNLLVERLCRYWSLKREARRGAPLLKRLHLEPWTASGASRQQTDAEKAQKLKFLQMLRNDLEKVRMLAELVRKREKEKLRQVQVIKDVVDKFVFPHHGKLKAALETISAMDRQELFLNPVSRAEVPDYFDVIKEPMCWLFIDEKLEKNQYLDVADFQRDILLVLDNAMVYNAKDSPFHRVAGRIKKNAQPVLDELNSVGRGTGASSDDETDGQPGLLAGDLEPSSILLSALLHGANDTEQDMLSSIFSFELEKPKEPTPPPPTKPVKAPRKSITAAEKKKIWEEREAAAKDRSLNRSTRATRAAEQAFAQEAGFQPSSDVEMSSPRPVVPDSDPRSRRRSMRAAVFEAGPSTGLVKEAKPKVKPAVIESSTATPTLTSASGSGSTSPTKSSASNLHPQPRPQRGVVGLEAVPILSDRERREQERRLDIMTEEVGASDQFKRFNVGWVLPEGSKRKRAERPSDSSRSTSQPGQSSSASSRKPISSSSKAPISATSRPGPSLSPVQVLPRLEINASGSDLSSPPLSSALTSAAPTPVKLTRGGKRKAEVGVEQSTPRSSKRHKTGVSPSKKGKENDELDGSGNILQEHLGGDDGVEDEDMTPVPGESDEVENDVEVDKADAPIAMEDDQVGSERREAAAEEEAAGVEKEDSEEIEQIEGQEVQAEVQIGDEEEEEDEKIEAYEEEPEGGDQIVADEDESLYPTGTLVWAKVHSYPYFPAEIVDPSDSEDIPDEVLERASAEKKHAETKGREIWLVRFFDSTNSYGWVMEDRIEGLGDDDAVDKMYLAGKDRTRSKGFRHSSQKKQVEKGYKEALESMQSEDEAEGEEDGEVEEE